MLEETVSVETEELKSVAEDLKATRKANAKAKDTTIQKIVDGGETYLSFQKVAADHQQMMLSVMGTVLGYHEVRRMEHIYAVKTLMTHRDNIISEFQDYSLDVTDSKNFFNPMVVEIDNLVKEIKVQLADKLERGVAEFADLQYMFEKGTKVTAMHDGQLLGGVVDSIALHRSFFGSYYTVEIKVISNVYGSISDMPFKTNIGNFAGVKSIADLPVSFVNDADMAFLQARGEKYRKYATGVHFIQYQGQLARNSYWSSRKFRADGRAMLDISSFSQVDNDQYGSEGYASGIEDPDRRRGGMPVDLEIPDEDVWRTYPYVYGFSLSAKQWGRFAIEGVSDISFRTDAFEKLVLPEDDKELVKAIVQDEGGDFSDLIDGKGGGSIFLLHGPPGQGKTLTAEAIAEELQRPLYSISVGELGTSPESLESTLREILDVSTVWNSVLLLDEADIFLEERDEKDIVRNAMVGVFLRLLEYHQGVLFLTTNRVKNIDQAFYSRISIGLRFGPANQDKRRNIWNNLSSSAGVVGLDLDKLALIDLNGRQIKNVLKLSMKLARAKGGVVDNELIENVIKRTSNFSSEMSEEA